MDIYDFDSEFDVLRAQLEKVICNHKDYCAGKWRSVSGQHLRKIIANSQSINFKTIDEKIWALRNKTNLRPICSCGSNLNFKDSKHGFFKSCSRKCASSKTETKEKIKNTLKERYGDHHTKNKEWINNFVDNCKVKGSYQLMTEKYIERHGMLFPSNEVDVFIKSEVSRYKSGHNYKSLTYPSGKMAKVQGYEPQIIDYLLKAGINEDDIITDRALLPKIQYISNGKHLWYIPDIFVKSKNLLLDVVSGYSWQKNAVKNLSKKAGVKVAGFNHLIVIWDDSRNCIKEMLT